MNFIIKAVYYLNYPMNTLRMTQNIHFLSTQVFVLKLFCYIHCLMGCGPSKSRRISKRDSKVTAVTGKEMSEVIALEPDPLRHALAPLLKELPSEKNFQKQLSNINIVAEDPQNFFYFGAQLGSGTFSHVFQMEQISNSAVSACKVIRLMNKDHIRQIKTQIYLMTMIDSPYIIRYHYSYIHNNLVYMFMEYVDGGNLVNIIKNYQDTLQQEIIAYILEQVIIALNLIHSKGQIHRDLKADNILFSKSGQIKMSDFGISRLLTDKCPKLQDLVGTPTMMAPEMIRMEPYDQSIDIWALGILAFQLYHGKVPVQHDEDYMTMALILQSSAPVLQDASEQFTNFVSCCLQLDPKKRHNTHQLYNHPFIKNNATEGKQHFLSLVHDVTNTDVINLFFKG